MLVQNRYFIWKKKHLFCGGKSHPGNSIFPPHSFRDFFSCGSAELFIDSVSLRGLWNNWEFGRKENDSKLIGTVNVFLETGVWSVALFKICLGPWVILIKHFLCCPLALPSAQCCSEITICAMEITKAINSALTTSVHYWEESTDGL